jgi:hypothetical protein
VRPFTAFIASVMLAGCMHTRIDETPPSIETLKLLRAAEVPAISLGSFTDGGGKRPIARTVVIRGSTMKPPKGSSFAEFLKLSFESELKAAGKLDPGAPVAISAILTESRASENLSKGGAALAAEISVVRGSTQIFKKPYRVDTLWKSDFIGALAIPEAFRQYNALYPLLVRQVFADPDFQMALKRP